MTHTGTNSGERQEDTRQAHLTSDLVTLSQFVARGAIGPPASLIDSKLAGRRTANYPYCTLLYSYYSTLVLL